MRLECRWFWGYKRVIMEKLVVLDYSNSSISVYENPKDIENTETLLREYGHNIDECSFMFCESVTINLK